MLFAAAVFVGVGARLFRPGLFGALAPNLVPRESLPTAIAISSIAWQIGDDRRAERRRLALRDPSRRRLCDGRRRCSCVALVVDVPDRPGAAAAGADAIAIRSQQIVDGFAYVRDNRLVLGAITLDLFAVLLAGATALLPIYARDILHVGAQGLGLLAGGHGDRRGGRRDLCSRSGR